MRIFYESTECIDSSNDRKTIILTFLQYKSQQTWRQTYEKLEILKLLYSMEMEITNT
jgi:hypothetical protein